MHRAARVAASAHGGQVVLSRGPRSWAAWASPSPTWGSTGSKTSPSRSGSTSWAPALPTAQVHLQHQPAQPASSFMVGSEAAEVVAQLQSGARLVTLSGPGGSGKTRLAIESASELVPITRMGSSGSGSPRYGNPRSSRKRSHRPSERRTASQSTSASARCCCCWTTSSRWWRPLPTSRAPARDLFSPWDPRYEPRAPAPQGRGRVPGAAAGQSEAVCSSAPDPGWS